MQHVFAILFFVFVSDVIQSGVECQKPTVIFINSLADRGIHKLTRKLQAMNRETVDIPDIEYNIRKKYPSVRLALKEGSFGNLYTWKRSGDVFLTMDGNAVSVNLTTTFDNAVVKFKDFLANIGDIELGDEVTIYIKKNKIHLQATLLLTENGFKVTVDDLALTEFGDFYVERRKKGELQSEVSNNILTFVLNSYREKLRVKLGALLRRLLENILAKYDLL